MLINLQKTIWVVGLTTAKTIATRLQYKEPTLQHTVPLRTISSLALHRILLLHGVNVIPTRKSAQLDTRPGRCLDSNIQRYHQGN